MERDQRMYPKIDMGPRIVNHPAVVPVRPDFVLDSRYLHLFKHCSINNIAAIRALRIPMKGTPTCTSGANQNALAGVSNLKMSLSGLALLWTCLVWEESAIHDHLGTE